MHGKMVDYYIQELKVDIMNLTKHFNFLKKSLLI